MRAMRSVVGPCTTVTATAPSTTWQAVASAPGVTATALPMAVWLLPRSPFTVQTAGATLRNTSSGVSAQAWQAARPSQSPVMSSEVRRRRVK
ncbi:hypothetical protein D9M72_122450 [compost metagenome]